MLRVDPNSAVKERTCDPGSARGDRCPDAIHGPLSQGFELLLLSFNLIVPALVRGHWFSSTGRPGTEVSVMPPDLTPRFAESDFGSGRTRTDPAGGRKQW